jgi:hypothetical protein
MREVMRHAACRGWILATGYSRPHSRAAGGGAGCWGGGGGPPMAQGAFLCRIVPRSAARESRARGPEHRRIHAAAAAARCSL